MNTTINFVPADKDAQIQTGITAECDRISVLLRITERHRQSKNAGAELRKSLLTAQEAVNTRRDAGLWTAILGDYTQIDLSAPMVADILAICLFPYLRPAAAYTIMGFQSGSTEPAITQGLLHELIMPNAAEDTVLQNLLSPVSPLVTENLVRLEDTGPLRRIHPGALLQRAVMGEDSFANLPNGIRLISSHTQKTPELFLTNETQKRLNEILSLARITDAMPYMNRIQGGPAVLFIGAPGTGKSLAARHIAEKLAKPLFQLDLGKVVSKWVGETERNLSQVFEQMSGTNGCILIDEADAILGKRVSVKEGRDHYVNITVSHLLSLLEAHKGLVMLTSNLRGNLDGAYSRRFAAIVEFRRPSAELREKIWTNGLSERVVSTDPQVIAKMAASIDLSAAEINNVITMATAIAAISEDSLSPTHIVQAIIYEKTKTSMTFTKADLHDLAPYADQIL